MMARGQVRTRFNGEYDVVVDMDFNSLKIVMDLHGIRDQFTMMKRVRSVFFYFLNKEREK
jgi:hypothetical protein